MLPNLIGMLYKGKSFLLCYLARPTCLYMTLSLLVKGDQNIKGSRNGTRYGSFEWGICLDTRRFCVSLTLLSFVLCNIILMMLAYHTVFMQSCSLHLRTSFQEMELTSQITNWVYNALRKEVQVNFSLGLFSRMCENFTVCKNKRCSQLLYWDAGNSSDTWTHTFSLWCMNPSVVFKDLADLSLSIILTSG